MKLSDKLKLVAVFTIINFTDCDAQFSTNPAEGARTTGVQYIHTLDQLTSPVEYEIEGSPYYTEDYSKGSVYASTGRISDIEIRYNIFYDRMEYLQGGSLYAIDPDMLIEKILLGTQTFVVDHYEFKGNTKPSYFLRLDSGKVTLMTKMTVVFKDRQQGKPIEGNIPAKYERTPDLYYFKLDHGPLIKARNVKKIIDALPDRKQEMEEFARKEKISVNKPEELTRFIHYYNSLK